MDRVADPSSFFSPPQAVLFDYGVVLSGPPDPDAWARMVAITGLAEPAFRAAYWAPRHDYDRGHHTGAAYWRTAGVHAGVLFLPAQIEALIEADNALWTQRNEPMIAWARRLQAAGTGTGVLSNLGDSMTAGVLARQPWLAAFDHLLWSHAVKMAKPEAAIYHQAIAGLGVPAESILFIDDREDNVAGGVAAGMQVIWYTTQERFEEEMKARGLAELWHSGRSPAR